MSKPYRARIKKSEKKDYHLDALSQTYDNPSKAIDVMMQTKLQEIVSTNQHVTESLLKVVILCGKQGLVIEMTGSIGLS